jgi:glyoxylase-like metal-dependent hydrolase (beta-lactamase superfamily II)
VPAYVHPADRFLLADPLAGVSPQFAALVGAETFTEPDEVRELADGEPLGLAGVLGFDLVVDHAPGHTKGSVTFTLPRLDDAGDPDVMFSGDLLFAGSIGRSDLPGGDPAEMTVSLGRVVLPRPDDTLVLPGHGGRTTIGRERATNPFLQGLRNVDSARPGL